MKTPKMIGAMKPDKVVPGGFSHHRPRVMGLYGKDHISGLLHAQIKEAANKVLERRP